MALPNISPYPAAPDPDSPSTFPSLAYQFTVAQRTNATEMNTLITSLNALLPTLAGGGWATTGGTANAITLTADYSALFRGMQVRFRAISANTGAATINLDGLGARQCRTITGAALPAGYIRTNADTVATYDGTYWVLGREDERGSNANGNFIRRADGMQRCDFVGIAQDTNTAAGGFFYTATTASWTFPAAFSTVPHVSGAPLGSTVRWVVAYASADTTAAYRQAAPAVSSLALTSSLLAEGYWY